MTTDDLLTTGAIAARWDDQTGDGLAAAERGEQS